MSGSILRISGSSDLNITEIITVMDAQRLGKDSISLDNFSTTSNDYISAGSVAEIAGSLYRFSTAEPVSTVNILSTGSMTYALCLIPSSSIVTAAWSSATPTWRSDYGFWYESTTSNRKVIAECEFDHTTSLYWYKWMLHDLNRLREKSFVSTITISTTAGAYTFADHHLSTTGGRIKQLNCITHFSTLTVGYYNSNDVANPASLSVCQILSTRLSGQRAMAGDTLTAYITCIYV